MNIFKNKPFWVAILATIGLKLCCWGPMVLIGIGGISGSAAIFSWADQYKPLFLGIAITSLAFAFYQAYRPSHAASSCSSHCQQRASLIGAKSYVWILAIFVIFMTGLTYMPVTMSAQFEQIDQQVSPDTTYIVMNIEGMSCTGCEANINETVSKIKGVMSIKASFKEANAEIRFDSTRTDRRAIIKAIEAKGYKIIPKKK